MKYLLTLCKAPAIYSFFSLVLLFSLFGCSESEGPLSVDYLADKQLQYTIGFEDHTLEVYTDGDEITVGYTPFYFKLINNLSKGIETDYQLAWTPLMHMTNMTHSCPKTDIKALDSKGSGLKTAYAIFQMASNQSEYWVLNLELSLDGVSQSVQKQIQVKNPADGHARIQSFVGSDAKRYVLAMTAPIGPKVGANLMSAQLYQMENMMTFSQIKDAQILIDPRMPGMGNHSSPNNVPLTFNDTSSSYEGVLNLTMTGYWKISLILENAAGELLKGEAVTEENEASSLYVALEF